MTGASPVLPSAASFLTGGTYGADIVVMTNVRVRLLGLSLMEESLPTGAK